MSAGLLKELQRETEYDRYQVVGLSRFALKNLHWAAGAGYDHVTLQYDRKQTFANDLIALKREKLAVSTSGNDDFKEIEVSWKEE